MQRIKSLCDNSLTEAARALRAIYLNIVGDTKTEIEEGVTWTTGEIEGLRDVIKLYAKDAWDAAQASGGIIDPMEAIAGLAKSVKDGVLSEAELMEMVSDIGGKLRTSQLLALINNWDMYETMLAQYRDAFGSADKEVENAMDSWTRKTNVLKNTWTEFVQKSLSTNLLKNAIDLITRIVKDIGNLASALKIIAGFYLAAKIGKLLSSIKLMAEAVELNNGGLKNAIKVLFTYRASVHAAEVEGKALEAQQLATDAANKSLAMSFSWVTAAIAVLTIAYTAYTVASNKAQEAHEKEVEASYRVGENAKTQSDKIYDLYIETAKADGVTSEYTDTINTLADALGKTLPDATQESIDKLNEFTALELADNLAKINASKITAGKEFVGSSNEAIKSGDYARLTSTNEGGLSGENPIGISMWAGGDAEIQNAIRRFFYDERFFTEKTETSSGEDENFTSTFFVRNAFGEDDVENAVAYRNAIADIVDLYDAYVLRTGDASVMNTEFYRQATAYLAATSDEMDDYTSKSEQAMETMAQYIIVAENLLKVDLSNKWVKEGVILTLQKEYKLTREQAEAVVALVEVTHKKIKATDDETGSTDESTDATEKNISAQDRLTVAKQRATAAAQALVPVLFDESGKLTEVAEEALRTSSYLADLVQAEIDLQKETQIANYARIRAELAALSGEALRTAKAIMAAYAASASMMTLKVYAAENGATPEIMRALTLLNSLEAWEAEINRLGSYSSQITPYTSNYKPSSSSGGSSGSSSSRPSSSSSSSSTTKTEDEKLKALQNRLTLLKSELSLMQERGDSEEDQIKKMKEIMKALHNEAAYLRSIGGDQATINNLSQEWWSYHNKIESIMNKEAEDAERQAKAIQDAVNAQIALNNALKQRNVRIYNAATGRWEWTANPNDVNSARDAYNSAMANLSPSDMDAYYAALEKAYAPTTGFRGSELFVQWLKGNGNSGGSTHNGNNYNFGNFTFTEAQAKGISLYDLAQLSRSLSIFG